MGSCARVAGGCSPGEAKLEEFCVPKIHEPGGSPAHSQMQLRYSCVTETRIHHAEIQRRRDMTWNAMDCLVIWRSFY